MFCCCSIHQTHGSLLRARLGGVTHHTLRAALAASATNGHSQSDDAPSYSSASAPSGESDQATRRLSRTGERVDVLFKNGTILTMTDQMPEAEAICLSGNTIVYVGDLAGAEALAGPDTRIVDLNGRLLMPGFIEPHMHVIPTAGAVDWLDLSVASIQPYTFENIQAAIKGATPINGWILGKGFDPSQLTPWQDLTVDILDAITGNYPAFITNQSGHIAYANTRSLGIAGITKDTPNPPEGKIARFASTGELSGILIEISAITMVASHLPLLSDLDILKNIKEIFQQAARVGNTMLFDAGIGLVLGPEIELKIYEALFALSDIPVRMGGALYFNQNDIPALVGKLSSMKPRLQEDKFRYSAVKMFADGSNQGLTGLQTTPYNQTVLSRTVETFVGTDIKGWQDAPVADMTQVIEAANSNGWQVAIHANGQQAITNTLSAYTDGLNGASGLDMCHRVEHASLMTDDHISTMAQLGVTPTFLIGHVAFWGRVLRDSILDPQRANMLDRCRSAADAGLAISMHCDLAVTPLGPLCEIQHAVTRIMSGTGGEVLNPAECIPVELALQAQTRHAAWVCHADDIVGTLETGKLADLVILEKDPRAVPPETISQIPISETWSDGKVVYSNPGGDVSGCGVGLI